MVGFEIIHFFLNMLEKVILDSAFLDGGYKTISSGFEADSFS